MLRPQEILSFGRAHGLDGVCITDHDSTKVLSQITEGFQSDGLLVLVGMEYTTPQGDFLIYGNASSLPAGLDYPELLSVVEAGGGAIVAAHPFRGWRPSDTGMIEKYPCAAIEVENGRNTELENHLASGFARKSDLPFVAGSDAHSLEELGRFPTRFTEPVNNMDDLVRALKGGKCEPAFSNMFTDRIVIPTGPREMTSLFEPLSRS